MDEKTIMDEVLNGSHNQSAERQRLDKANQLLEQGRWADADKLFDEVLAVDPTNKDAHRGKRLISRQLQVEKRLSSVNKRAETAIPLDMPRGNNPLRKKSVLAAVLIAFALTCAAAAAFIGINMHNEKLEADTQDSHIVSTDNQN